MRTELQTNLEFLTTFFSQPDNALMEQIRLGETPLGTVEKSDTEFSFADEKMVLISELFINSKNERPIFPLATEYFDEKKEKEEFIENLILLYESHNKVVTNYPPDHIKVLLEFVLFNLSQNDITGLKDFYTIFLKPWYNRFSESIKSRSNDSLAVQLTALIQKTMIHIESL